MGSVHVDGAEYALKTPTDGQLAAVGKYVMIMETPNMEARSRMMAVTKLNDILVNLFSEGDREAVEIALEHGSLTLVQIIQAAMSTDAAATEAPKVRRGRPRKLAS